MHYLCLASDYDGTLAHHGRVNRETFAAMERLRESGRKLFLVTGRELDDLQKTCCSLDVFDCVVAENGALIYHPETADVKLLGPVPEPSFVEELRHRGVTNLSVGKVIVATWEPHETVVLEVIRDLGLGLQVIFNKGAVMILPTGITKATGLIAALKEYDIARDNVVGIGDAENDHALLEACRCGVATANAVPALKERADWVTPGDHGLGVSQLIERLLENDLADLTPRVREPIAGAPEESQTQDGQTATARVS